MEVLHAIWGCNTENKNKFHMWAESSRSFSIKKNETGRKKKLHPFAASKNELKELINDFSLPIDANLICFEKIKIMLPSHNKKPVPSPWLLLDEDPIDPTSIDTWDINTSTLNPFQSFNALLKIPQKINGNIVVGDSFYFWAEVAKFALDIIIKQKFIPSIIKDESGKYVALWQPVFETDDKQRIQLFSKVIPPSCCSLHNEKRIPYEIITSFINGVIDAFIRNTLSSLSFARYKQTKDVARDWMVSLSTENSTLKISGTTTVSFSKKINTWLSQITQSSQNKGFRTCFRIDPPAIEEEIDNDKWWIRFFLQANDDRSLLVPAEKVWNTQSDSLTIFNHRFENPQEQLLMDLGRASKIFKDIDSSLNLACPIEIGLNTESAYTFLREQAPLLEQNGFGVLLPKWWKKSSEKIGVKLKVKAPEGGVRSGLFGRDGLVNYDWELSIGNKVISPDEFQKLADLKVPLVKIRGKWVELRKEDVEKAIAFFKESKDQQMTLGEALRFGLGAEDERIGLPVVDIEAEGKIKNTFSTLLQKKGKKIKKIPQPKSFNGTLRPYQIKGMSWLLFLKKLKLSSCLADDMGLGKTIQLIVLLLHEREKRNVTRPTLIICPMSVMGNWEKEIQRFAPSLNSMIHHGADRLKGKNFKNISKKHDIVLTTYALACRDEKSISNVKWDSVVLDEAQNIKNPFAKQTRAIKRIQSPHRVALTGTPVENRLSELWSIMDFLNPGYLGSTKQFRSDFALPIERYHNKKQAKILRQMIQPFVLRRLKTDPTIIKDLPEKMEMKVYCNLSVEQASLYEAAVKNMLSKIDQSEGIQRKGLILTTILQLKQICNHPALFAQDGSPLPNRSGKLIRLEEMLEEMIAVGDKGLIFTQFSGMGMMLRHRLQEKLGCEVLFLHGGISKKKRDIMIQRFQNELHGPPVFILSLKAGGLGLNLTAANHVFHFDRWWNPAVENQATDRVFRIGQKKNVEVHKFVSIGTLEERIDEMIEQKKQLADSVVGTGESWLTEFSTDQLRSLFKLSSDAVRGD
ncbi:MAG: hypothetical protein DRN27_00600 [Thermoplasmata archaeon]|nr:MAG: hypothetical protein DRN27_00600 [Thermoplasmata archaeon]